MLIGIGLLIYDMIQKLWVAIYNSYVGDDEYLEENMKTGYRFRYFFTGKSFSEALILASSNP